MRLRVPKTVMRYISAEFAKSLAITLCIITAVWVLLFSITMVRREAMGPKAFLMALPVIALISLKYTLPLAVLFGASVSYGRMSTENEVRAMEWNGIHVGWIIAPAAAIAVLASGLALYLNTSGIPAANRRLGTILRANIFDVIDHQLISASRGRNTIVIKNVAVSIVAYDPDAKVIQGITVLQVDDEQRPIRRIDAPSARILAGKIPGAVVIASDSAKPEEERRYVSFQFALGVVTEFDPETTMLIARYLAPAVALDMSKLEDAGVGNKGLSSRELATIVRSGRGAARHEALTDIYERIALGVSPVFFVLLAGPMAVIARWKHVLTSFLPSLGVVIVIYYPLVAWGKVWGEEGRMNPMYGMFAGDFAVLLVAALVIIVLLRR